jgi:hypothetical protein
MAHGTLHLGDVHTNAKDTKMVPLTDAGERCFYTFPEATRCCFGPDKFDKDASAPRQNLQIRVSGEAAEYFRGLDDWAVDYISEHSERLVKEQLTVQQVRDAYHPTIRQTPGYEPLLRAKINMPNSCGACRCWTAGGESHEPPVDRRDADVTPQVHISHI